MLYTAFVTILFAAAFIGAMAVIMSMTSRYWAQMRVALGNLAPHGFDAVVENKKAGRARAYQSSGRISPALSPRPLRSCALGA
jgi:hypothetical protein